MGIDPKCRDEKCIFAFLFLFFYFGFKIKTCQLAKCLRKVPFRISQKKKKKNFKLGQLLMVKLYLNWKNMYETTTICKIFSNLSPFWNSSSKNSSFLKKKPSNLRCCFLWNSSFIKKFQNFSMELKYHGKTRAPQTQVPN